MGRVLQDKRFPLPQGEPVILGRSAPRQPRRGGVSNHTWVDKCRTGPSIGFSSYLGQHKKIAHFYSALHFNPFHFHLPVSPPGAAAARADLAAQLMVADVTPELGAVSAGRALDGVSTVL